MAYGHADCTTAFDTVTGAHIASDLVLTHFDMQRYLSESASECVTLWTWSRALTRHADSLSELSDRVCISPTLSSRRKEDYKVRDRQSSVYSGPISLEHQEVHYILKNLYESVRSR